MAALSAKLRSIKIDDLRSGISFWCPGCDSAHRVTTQGPNAWDWDRDVDLPTLHPSILVHGGHAGSHAICHSFVRQGVIEFLDDCTHALRGQRAPLPDWPDPG